MVVKHVSWVGARGRPGHTLVVGSERTVQEASVPRSLCRLVFPGPRVAVFIKETPSLKMVFLPAPPPPLLHERKMLFDREGLFPLAGPQEASESRPQEKDFGARWSRNLGPNPQG